MDQIKIKWSWQLEKKSIKRISIRGQLQIFYWRVRLIRKIISTKRQKKTIKKIRTKLKKKTYHKLRLNDEIENKKEFYKRAKNKN